MRQRLIIFLGLFIVIAVLIALNAASYTQKEKIPDSELLPNRSTFNGGATGTRAYFDLLNETGRRPVRWIEPISDLNQPNSPDVFVVIGSLREEFTKEEATELLRWVSGGKRLVVISREPAKELVATDTSYEIKFGGFENPFISTDAYNQSEMTISTNAAKPASPSIFTTSVNAIQPSRFSKSIEIRRRSSNELVAPSETTDSFTAETPMPHGGDEFEVPTPNPVPTGATADQNTAESEDDEILVLAPLVLFANDRKNIVVDAPYGAGRIIYVSDPYIVSNTGIGIADNAAFAIRLAATNGTVAFDEYHHGYGSNRNRFFEFFAGTPVIGIFLQLFLIVGLLLFSQSRRFARPVPEPEPNRLSKLEYVSAMAELQQRTSGYDLAMENIYGDFKRRVSKLLGVDNHTTPRGALARLIVERVPSENLDEIDSVLKRCEDINYGDVTKPKEMVRLTKRLREIETELGLLRRKEKRRRS